MDIYFQYFYIKNYASMNITLYTFAQLHLSLRENPYIKTNIQKNIN
jgi:hypothetical protein